ncbi:uncharacterized protein MONBRDRAFT_32801 [Monosiga brevicollis MX1]|uniref:BBSome complex member BBS5 n=1 Tax=Monosiga brevicollis TaxID=81824 RepID=A9V1S9_MONBE|nr:uncharacterized protein MONBRDRAFT_32801 [Monosiga brevicollis MX1]EDQ88616.1 predicted protein [Monosiga brevicollis MX1]|eukprot:XP_001746720.1 hypothetical protein [Monosiga brevicollis MX1]
MAEPVEFTAENPWRDREVHFDIGNKLIALTRGEFVIDHLDQVEDTKGNNGISGTLTVTNLRLIWTNKKRSNINLSIGLRNVVSIQVKPVESKLLGNVKALWIMCKHKQSKYQFIFTHLVPGSPRLFTTVPAVHRAYASSTLYRDVKIRAPALIRDGAIEPLPQEEVYDALEGVSNLSGEKGELGRFIVTNIRFIWYSEQNPLYNVSCPYYTVSHIGGRQSKFGSAVVVKLAGAAGALNLGFRCDPPKRMAKLLKMMQRLHRVYHITPLLGIEAEVEEQPTEDLMPENVPDDDVEIVQQDKVDTMAAYFSSDSSGTTGRDPVFSAELGLAIEPLPAGVSLQDLWRVQ